MSFLYPHTINITRPGAQPSTAVGDQGEAPSGDTALETSVATDLPAGIQEISRGGRNPTGLPGDATVSIYRIVIPPSAAANGLIQARDIVTDELGSRYQVISPYWNSLGYQLRAQLLEP